MQEFIHPPTLPSHWPYTTGESLEQNFFHMSIWTISLQWYHTAQDLDKLKMCQNVYSDDEQGKEESSASSAKQTLLYFKLKPFNSFFQMSLPALQVDASQFQKKRPWKLSLSK